MSPPMKDSKYGNISRFPTNNKKVTWHGNRDQTTRFITRKHKHLGLMTTCRQVIHSCAFNLYCSKVTNMNSVTICTNLFYRMYQQKGRRTNFSEVPLSKVKSIIKEARGIQFPWDAIPEPTQSWLQAMAGAINTQPEFILLGALTVTSCLMGPECKVQIRSRHAEPCNIFTACLCEPGTEKTQAYKVAVETPLQYIPSKILVHDYTSKGLFEHLKTREGMIRTSLLYRW